MFGISALKTSIPSSLRRPKICSVLRDFICENELKRKCTVSIKYWMVEARKSWTHLQSYPACKFMFGELTRLQQSASSSLLLCDSKVSWFACFVRVYLLHFPSLFIFNVGLLQSQSNKIELGFVFNLPSISNTQDSVQPHFQTPWSAPKLLPFPVYYIFLIL